MTPSLRCCLCLAGLFLLSTAVPWYSLRAADEIRPRFTEAAKDIKAVMDAENAESVTVKGFKDDTTMGATVLNGFQQLLTEELTKVNVTVKPTGGFIGVEGHIKAAVAGDAQSSKDRILRIEFQLLNKFGDELKSLDKRLTVHGGSDGDADLQKALVHNDTHENNSAPPDRTVIIDHGRIRKDIDDPAAAVVAFGGTVDIEKRVERLLMAEMLKTQEHPTAFIADGVTAKASRTSRYGVQVISNGAAKPLKLVDGQPSVDFAKGETFTLRIVNGAESKMSATITLDGINSHLNPKYSQWICEPGIGDIRGWQKDDNTAQEFVATNYEHSKLKELGLAATPVGAISVVFRAAWLPTNDPPDDEELFKAPDIAGGPFGHPAPGAGDPNFIGGGNDVENKVVAVKPVIGRVRSVVSIRYRHPTSSKD